MSAPLRPSDMAPNSPTSGYSPSEVISALTDFYTFLSTLPWIEPTDVLLPPPGGWPNITRESFAFLGKNDTVIDLLRRLPYLRMDGQGRWHESYLVAWETYACDYRRDYFQQPAFESHSLPWEIPQPPGNENGNETDFSFPEWAVALTYGKNKGIYLMLDTSDGTVWKYQTQFSAGLDLYTGTQKWRNECVEIEETKRLPALLGEWKAKYESLEWILFPRTGYPAVWYADEREGQEMKGLIRSFGWPDTFDREGCKKALVEWEETNRNSS